MSAIVKFRALQEGVYGPLASNEEEAKTWTPPEKSGGHRERYDPTYLIHAQRLTEKIHDVLGRTRDGIARLPGASDANPVGGGLRIGKEDAGGSDGDGQYHHYLTLWIFALNRLSLATQDVSYNQRAISLAKTIHPRFFIDKNSSRPRMVWKIAMDMSKPLVWSQGNLDPLDGYVVFRKLQAATGDPTTLAEEIADYKRVIELKGKHSVSTDTLDLGMTLWTLHWLKSKENYFGDLMKQGVLQAYRLYDGGYLELPLRRRLALREYGTCLGIGCLDCPDERLEAFRSGIVGS